MQHAWARILARLTARRSGADRGVSELGEAALHAAEAAATDEEFAAIAAPVIDEPVLFASERQARQAEPVYTRWLALTQQRLGPEHRLTRTAQLNLASVYATQGRFQEAAALAEQLLPVLRGAVGERDPAVMIMIDNLILWYRRAGRTAEAAALEREQWAHLPVCAHLQPVEDYIRSVGGQIVGRGLWGGVIVSVAAYLDVAALQQRLRLASCVEVTELADPHYGWALGVRCAVHGDAIWGHHPSEEVTAPTIA